MPGQLTVWLFDSPVGTLVQINGRLGFSYAPDWLAHNAATPLSQSLPRQAKWFDDRATRPFFAGLLPEGEQRKRIAQALHISRQNDFALLEPGQTPPSADVPNAVRWSNDTELLRLIEEMPQRPMLAGDADMRLSLAGAQDKLPVVIEGVRGVRIGLPRFGTPSTHILKPMMTSALGIEGSVFNEGFCMALASTLQLNVAPTAIAQVGDRPYLLVERYDRQKDTKQRLHQEDFCQALGMPPEIKYQNEGGPDLAQSFALLRRATRPSTPQVLQLLDAVIFNALIGNHDAHGKNFSLLYTPRGAVLAPLYNLLATAVYPRLPDKMAMKIGSKYRFTEVQAPHWECFAVDAGLSPAQVKNAYCISPNACRRWHKRSARRGRHRVTAIPSLSTSQRWWPSAVA
ncbi:type II toxin-antitoxin system HipA family toxin [Simplicispira psychrophila]|uniref:type II toxin-antitoxin system HipA family toxin n=1 Tax=Simplicispira psychrophila TaxID=80882 RepID=UPI000AA3CD56|nr:type II toxin-antitoxin system HipA family toxin [Simplicispira psychrophila]